MSNTKTKGIRINVEPKYLPQRSDPTKPIYFFTYHITIINESDEKIQLVSRYWHITDSNGNIEEIRGPGVVGKQPNLKAGESFKYTSFCPIPTEFGVMHGAFQMVRSDGVAFDARIKPFKLAVPFSVN
ncbi:MAG TPA: Co2+/Mg2+ efflux protein ApaG [Candidatus Marinimicrobia bacterium]|jgi:ApaG protein|nr:Co2+/Mg2+ efflux protein ApaG [Candidatus Neomarinimicrobiota bacterium]MDP7330853.1 Co2+/Mg2+ efflux protein ApaG [Candidatus Neomarinimicrobiota bacterium]MDP7436788.1 Co2+/Mg2+ efflux protein ApaG [Candidatus Neomarinimicrobiota bacterium]HBN45185.1 Co2+/Mg2+ efflux protein ApaG [Candidatus Neomarinimicrobiota bacterium]HJL73811.1 Co2+/Mg2+ efflux protein ApaG [Candidatus Neomarinimicrobiota bacterium]|tara:strand:+ start:1318 stop:1701 length:384 start_codon:yes stop_codon:yes gene_type:complete